MDTIMNLYRQVQQTFQKFQSDVQDAQRSVEELSFTEWRENVRTDWMTSEHMDTLLNVNLPKFRNDIYSAHDWIQTRTHAVGCRCGCEDDLSEWLLDLLKDLRGFLQTSSNLKDYIQRIYIDKYPNDVEYDSDDRNERYNINKDRTNMNIESIVQITEVNDVTKTYDNNADDNGNEACSSADTITSGEVRNEHNNADRIVRDNRNKEHNSTHETGDNKLDMDNRTNDDSDVINTAFNSVDTIVDGYTNEVYNNSNNSVNDDDETSELLNHVDKIRIG